MLDALERIMDWDVMELLELAERVRRRMTLPISWGPTA
jgi:hypothetical protein